MLIGNVNERHIFNHQCFYLAIYDIFVRTATVSKSILIQSDVWMDEKYFVCLYINL